MRNRKILPAAALALMIALSGCGTSGNLKGQLQSALPSQPESSEASSQPASRPESSEASSQPASRPESSEASSQPASRPSTQNIGDRFGSTGGSSTEAGSKVTEEELALIGGSLYEIAESNRLSRLLQFYDMLYYFVDYDNGNQEETIFTMFQGEFARLEVVLTETYKNVLRGYVNWMSFENYPERVQGYICYPEGREGEAFGVEYSLSGVIDESAEIRKIEELGEYIAVTVYRPDSELWAKYVVQRGNLMLVQAFNYYDLESAPFSTCTLETSGDDHGIVSNFLTAWEETRTIHLTYDQGSDGGVFQITEDWEVPASWEVTPWYPWDVSMYMNTDMTQPYEYPGDGTDDYTIYVTEVMG